MQSEIAPFDGYALLITLSCTSETLENGGSFEWGVISPPQKKRTPDSRLHNYQFSLQIFKPNAAI